MKFGKILGHLKFWCLPPEAKSKLQSKLDNKEAVAQFEVVPPNQTKIRFLEYEYVPLRVRIIYRTPFQTSIVQYQSCRLHNVPHEVSYVKYNPRPMRYLGLRASLLITVKKKTLEDIRQT